MDKDFKKKIKDMANSIGDSAKKITEKTSEIVKDAADKYDKSELKPKVNDAIKNVERKTSDIRKDAVGKYNKSELKPKIDNVVSDINEKIEESGVKDKFKEAQAATSEQLDTFTGTKQYELMQERMTLQQRYNDVLATKLEEALQRIEGLEKHLKVDKLKNKK